MMTVSIIIRTLNESRYLDDLLEMISRQTCEGIEIETVLVDSGSTDGTVQIAEGRGAKIVHIAPKGFSFGRALNMGCAASRGDILVLISGHCVPVGPDWIASLCAPLAAGQAYYSYGHQIADDTSNLSERWVFDKYYLETSAIPQDGFFCNNANAALKRHTWDALRFDETLTGLEDMELAKRMVAGGGRVAYVAEAAVFHHHNETWAQVHRRYEREAIALQKILPEVTLSRGETFSYIIKSVWDDWKVSAKHQNRSTSKRDMFRYRYCQYMGSYQGNHERRVLSRQVKQKFFYPETEGKDKHDVWLESHRRISPN